MSQKHLLNFNLTFLQQCQKGSWIQQSPCRSRITFAYVLALKTEMLVFNEFLLGVGGLLQCLPAIYFSVYRIFYILHVFIKRKIKQKKKKKQTYKRYFWVLIYWVTPRFDVMPSTVIEGIRKTKKEKRNKVGGYFWAWYSVLFSWVEFSWFWHVLSALCRTMLCLMNISVATFIQFGYLPYFFSP